MEKWTNTGARVVLIINLFLASCSQVNTQPEEYFVSRQINPDYSIAGYNKHVVPQEGRASYLAKFAALNFDKTAGIKVTKGVDIKVLENLYQLNHDTKLAVFLAKLDQERTATPNARSGEDDSKPIRVTVQIPCGITDGLGNSCTGVLTVVYTVSATGQVHIEYSGMNFEGHNTPAAYSNIDSYANVTTTGQLTMSGLTSAQWQHTQGLSGATQTGFGSPIFGANGNFQTTSSTAYGSSFTAQIYYQVSADLNHLNGNGYTRVNGGTQHYFAIQP
jgi:hypothetical protein